MSHTLLPQKKIFPQFIENSKQGFFSFKKNWRYLFMLMSILAVSRFSAQACGEKLYEEYFSCSNDTRYNSNWIVDISGVTLTGPDDFFAVYDNRWKAKDLDGDAYWKTYTVNIAGLGNVSASVEIEGYGAMETDDYIKVYYILNGGSMVLFEQNGEKYGAFSKTTATQDELSGSTLQIVVKINFLHGKNFRNTKT